MASFSGIKHEAKNWVQKLEDNNWEKKNSRGWGETVSFWGQENLAMPPVKMVVKMC